MASKRMGTSEREIVRASDPPVVLPPCKAEDTHAEHAELFHPEALRLACPLELLGKSLPKVDGKLYGYRPRAGCHAAAELYALEVAQHRALCGAVQGPSAAAALLQAARPRTAPAPVPQRAAAGVLTPRPPATAVASASSARNVGGFHTGD